MLHHQNVTSRGLHVSVQRRLSALYDTLHDNNAFRRTSEDDMLPRPGVDARDRLETTSVTKEENALLTRPAAAPS